MVGVLTNERITLKHSRRGSQNKVLDKHKSAYVSIDLSFGETLRTRSWLPLWANGQGWDGAQSAELRLHKCGEQYITPGWGGGANYSSLGARETPWLWVRLPPQGSCWAGAATHHPLHKAVLNRHNLPLTVFGKNVGQEPVHSALYTHHPKSSKQELSRYLYGSHHCNISQTLMHLPSLHLCEA